MDNKCSHMKTVSKHSLAEGFSDLFCFQTADFSSTVEVGILSIFCELAQVVVGPHNAKTVSKLPDLLHIALGNHQGTPDMLFIGPASRNLYATHGERSTMGIELQRFCCQLLQVTWQFQLPFVKAIHIV